MEFVSWTLMTFSTRVNQIQSYDFEVHKLGGGVGIYDYQIGEQKVYEVMEQERKRLSTKDNRWNQQNENVVSLDFRKKKQETKKEFLPSLTFEPGKYYIYPELGVMVHCILLTDKFHTQKDPVYIMEDQFGNIFGEQMVEGVTIG